MRTLRFSKVIILAALPLTTHGFYLSSPLSSKSFLSRFDKKTCSTIRTSSFPPLDPPVPSNSEQKEVSTPNSSSSLSTDNERRMKKRLRKWAQGISLATLLTGLFHKDSIIAPSHAVGASAAARSVSRNRVTVTRSTNSRRNHGNIKALKRNDKSERKSRNHKDAMMSTRGGVSTRNSKTKTPDNNLNKDAKVALIVGSGAGVLLGRVLIHSKKGPGVRAGSGIAMLGKNLILSKKKKKDRKNEKDKFNQLMGWTPSTTDDEISVSPTHTRQGQKWVTRALEKVGYSESSSCVDEESVTVDPQEPIFSYYNDTMPMASLAYVTGFPAPASSTALRVSTALPSTSSHYLNSLSMSISSSSSVFPTYSVTQKYGRKPRSGSIAGLSGSSFYLETLSS